MARKTSATMHRTSGAISSLARATAKHPTARPHRHLVFGVNDVELRNAGAREAASGLGLNQYAVPVSWHPGQKLTGQELGSIPHGGSVLAYLYGTAKDAPRTQAQRHEYANFARGLVKQNPQIRELQVWNEPTHPYFWPGKNRARSYLPLLANTYDRLRGSHVKVVAPGSYPGLPQQMAFVGATRRYYRGTGRKRPLFDIYASHPYWDWQKTGKVAKAMNRQWEGLPQATPKRGLSFWWTETGMDTGGTAAPPGYTGYHGHDQAHDPRLMGTVQQQAKRIGALVQAAQRNPYVGALFNFLLTDEADLSRWQSGLLTPTGERKPAYLAYQQAIKNARARGF